MRIKKKIITANKNLTSEMFYTAVEQAGDAIFIAGKNGIIEYVNPAFEKLTGYKKSEAIGKTPRIVNSGHQPVSYYKKLWSTILSGAVFRATVVNKKKSGELFYADHTIAPIKNLKGEVTNFVAIWRDITKSKELEKRKDDFISVASHELKTPITAIKAYSELLKKHLEKTGDIKNSYILSKILLKISSLTRLMDQLLDVSRIEEGRLSLDKRKFDLDELIGKLIIDFQYVFNANEVVKIGNINKKVCGDEGRISQVLTNLVTNAIKYSHSNKKILIKVADEKTHAVICVIDEGVGIPKNKGSKIFERFYRISNSNSSGFGLGLYISSEIIKLHGGKMWVESNKGRGSSFYFTLPYK